MAATLSSVFAGARSVSFVATAGAADTVTFADLAVAYLAAGGSSTSAIYSFLTTPHTTNLLTLAAIAAVGGSLAYVSSAAAAEVTVSADNTLAIAAAGTVAIRLDLGYSASN